MLHPEKNPPEVYEGDFQQEYSFKGVGDMSFCTFLRIWAHIRSTYEKNQVRWHLHVILIWEQRQEDPWLAGLAEAMNSRYNETLSLEKKIEWLRKAPGIHLTFTCTRMCIWAPPNAPSHFFTFVYVNIHINK